MKLEFGIGSVSKIYQVCESIFATYIYAKYIGDCNIYIILIYNIYILYIYIYILYIIYNIGDWCCKYIATLGDRSFSFASSSVWNSIPNDVKCAPSLSSFKSRLKTYLFCSVYKD